MRILCRSTMITLVVLMACNLMATDKTVYMFVQSASSGSLEPIAGKKGAFLLTLKGVAPSTIFFSDRPKRISGQSPTDQFLEGFSFSADNPPNAAVQVTAADNSQRVAVVTLASPRYDVAAGTLQYDVTLLPGQKLPSGLHGSAPAGNLPPVFNNVALFIDDCENVRVTCYAAECCPEGVTPFENVANRCWPGERCGTVKNMPTCWDQKRNRCGSCGAKPEAQICAKAMKECCARSNDRCWGCVTRNWNE